MIKLAKRILVLLALLMAINSLVRHFFLPFGWGDNVLYVKHQYYEQHKDEYNALFLGGSLVYRHIDPHLLDSLCGEYGVEFNAFNFGVDGHGFLKQRWEMDEVLKDPSPDLKYMFVSLSSSSIFLRLNLHTRKFATWWRTEDIIYAIRLTWDLPMSFKRKLKFTWFYAVTFIENRLNFGHMTDAVQFHTKKEGYDESYLGQRKDGFYPYDDQAERQLMSQAWEDSLMKQSRIAYLTDTVQRENMLKANIREFNERKDEPMLDLMRKTYLKMIDRCAEKGIRLIVIMPPRIREPYAWLLPLYDALPEANKISLASPIEYPEFYAVENSYNFHHLNNVGANLYTHALAEKFLTLEGIDADLYPLPATPSGKAVPAPSPE